jgi:hypothetical protein
MAEGEEFNKMMKWAMAEIQGSSAYSLERDRPYDGQPHTDQGERGKQLVAGLTMRDVADCMVLGFLDAAGIERERPIRDDIYTIDLPDIDPGAVIQNALCHIEKMMGIYPNVPGLKEVTE